jgi:hypothetical protein
VPIATGGAVRRGCAPHTTGALSAGPAVYYS